MSDDFIPFNRSTPVRNQWNQGYRQSQSPSGFRNTQNEMRQWHSRRGKSAHNREYNNSHSFNNKGYNINDYLHPTMLDDLWAPIKRQREQARSNES